MSNKNIKINKLYIASMIESIINNDIISDKRISNQTKALLIKEV
jgi:hypothetical protein